MMIRNWLLSGIFLLIGCSKTLPPEELELREDQNPREKQNPTEVQTTIPSTDPDPTQDPKPPLDPVPPDDEFRGDIFAAICHDNVALESLLQQGGSPQHQRYFEKATLTDLTGWLNQHPHEEITDHYNLCGESLGILITAGGTPDLERSLLHAINFAWQQEPFEGCGSYDKVLIFETLLELEPSEAMIVSTMEAGQVYSEKCIETCDPYGPPIPWFSYKLLLPKVTDRCDRFPDLTTLILREEC